MVERIREILDVKQLTPTQFADVIGIARPIVSHILSGRNKPSLEVVQKVIAAFPDITLPWLLTGVGSMMAQPANVPQPGPSVVAATAPPKTPAVKGPKVPLQAQQGLSFDQEGQDPVAASLRSGFTPAASATAPAAEMVPTESLQAISQPVTVPAEIPVPAAQATAPAQATASLTSADAANTWPASQPAAASPTALPLILAPDKLIRRIVIFYQDGTFTDYQPER